MSAPSARQASSLSAVPAVTATRAPSSRASWIAIVPMPLEPPWTSSTSPGRRPAAMKTLAHTVQVTSGSAAASTSPMPRRAPAELADRDGDLLGVPTAGHQRAHLVADGPGLDARTDRRDPAGALHPRVRRGAGRRVVVTLALQGVGPVHPGRDDVHDDLAGTGLGVGDLCQDEDLGAAGFGDRDGAHGPTLGGRRGAPGLGRTA